MQCRLKRDIKEFILFSLGIGILGVVCWVLCVIVGYIALQIFDIAWYTGYVPSPIDYYAMNGFSIVMSGGRILTALVLIIIPIYSAIKYFKGKGMSWKSIKEIFLECE